MWSDFHPTVFRLLDIVLPHWLFSLAAVAGWIHKFKRLSSNLSKEETSSCSSFLARICFLHLPNAKLDFHHSDNVWRRRPFWHWNAHGEIVPHVSFCP